ncbi:alpha/beta fold hydrolase [Escherichia coli]|uniref:alpha/beta fold hydrolase n=1 Tax=Escherichia coli TaxID=562 RepID=UPI00358DD8A4
MKLSLSPPPYADAPVVVLISGLGGSGSYWLPQLAVLEQEYQVICYDQRGTGNNPDTLAEDYSITQMAAELHQALVAAGIERYAVVGHALGALVGMQLALDYPASVTVLVSVNGWLRINAHTRRCFQVREQLLHSGGALALAHFQGKNNLLRRLNALKRADFSRHADRIRCPVQIICASDDLLVPSACSSELHAALPDSQKMVMRYGGHACNVTDPETFNALLLNGLASLLHHREAACKELL